MGKFENINTLTDKIITELAGNMFAIGDVVAAEAHLLITAGSVSGAKHVASAPGEAPNNDTGRLTGGIEVHQTTPLKVQVVSTMPYSRPLEFGTSRMAARPFMVPAREMTRAEVRKLAAKAVNRAIRQFAAGR